MIATPRCFALALALALAGAGTLALAPLAFATPAAQRPTATPRPDFSKTTCVITTTTSVQPGAFLAGETISLTRTIRERCTYRPYPLHLVMVLDGTASMAGEAREAAVRAMESVVDDVAWYLGPGINRIAVVAFEERVRVLCAFTSDVDRLRRCIRQLDARGDASLSDGLEAGRRAFADGRELWPTLPSTYFREMIVLVSNAAAPARCDEAERQSALAQSSGVFVATVCAGRDCDRKCLQSLAYRPLFQYEARPPYRVNRTILQILNGDHFPGPSSFAVTETLPPAVVLDELSAPGAVVRQPDRVAWVERGHRTGVTTFTYRVRPLAPGYQPLSAGMHGTFRDIYGLTGAFAFDVPWARVLGRP